MNSGPKWSLRNGAQYRRLCARPGCGAAAVATLRFQSTQRQAWLVELDVNASRTQGDLCQRHAAALVLPRGWELHDERAPGTWTPVRSSGPDKSAKAGSGARRTRARRKKSAADAPPDAALPGFETVHTNPAAPPAAEVLEPEAVVPEVVVPEVDVEVEQAAVAAEPVAEGEPEPEPEPESPAAGHAARPVPAQFGTSDEEDVEEELGEILDARTPLLQRAFRNAKPLTGDEASESPDAPDSPDAEGD